MKKLIIIATLLAFLQVNGQFLSPNSINSGGSSGSSPNYKINQTIGQIFTSKAVTPHYQITEGFQQSGIDVWVGDSLSYFEVGNIPDWDIWQNQTTEFNVKSDYLPGSKKFRIEYDSLMLTEEDVISIDSITGQFRINLKSDQIYDLTVTFFALNDSLSVEQAVNFSLNQDLPPESDVFGFQPSGNLPDDDDNAYITKYVHNETTSGFNYLHNTVRFVTIAGKVIIIDSLYANNTFFSSYNNATDIGQMEIYAEKVIIRSPLKLPQTNVIIYAEELIFEDPTGQVGKACIITTPVTKPGSSSSNGANGLNAGNITLHIKKFISPLAFRFISEGGRGQTSIGTGYHSGNGGNGGNFSSTLQLNQYATVFAGAAGNVGGSATYGIPGVCGTKTIIPKEMSWLHPLALKSILLYTKDAYLLGHWNFVKQLSETYFMLVAKYQQLETEWNALPLRDQVDLLQMKQEFQEISQQIGANKDYYGNPAGWAPMLSFEVSMQMYNQEVDRALNLFYLSDYINRSQAVSDSIQFAMSQMIEEQQEQLTLNIASYEGSLESVPSMVENFQFMNTGIQNIVDSMTIKEQYFREQAMDILSQYKPICNWECEAFKFFGLPGGDERARVLYKQIEEILNGITAETPAIGYDPVQYHLFPDYNNPIGTITETFNLFEDLNNEDWSDYYADILDSLQNIDPNNLTAINNISEIVMNSQMTSAPILDFGNHFIDRSDDVKIALNKYLIRIDDLRSKDKSYWQLTIALDSLKNAQMDMYLQFVELLGSTSKLINDVKSEIVSIDALNRNIASFGDKMLDARAMQYLKDITQRSKARLQKYQYYMAKAYEYRFLEPYPGNLNLNNVINKFLQYFASGPSLNQTEFNSIKAIYQQELSVIAEDIYDYYQANWGGGQLRSMVQYTLSAEELQVLNQSQTMNLNFQELGIFSKNEEDVRVFNISVDNVTFEQTNGGQNGNIDLYFVHSGESRLRKGGKIYLFKNYTSKTEHPIRWGAKVQSSGSWSPILPSPLGQSIITALTGYSADDLMIYAYPAGWGDITLTKNDNLGSFNINSIRFNITYDFSLSNKTSIEVIPNEPILPGISMSMMDLGGRQNAQGYAMRIYTKTPYQNVQIDVEPQHGAYSFVSMQIESSSGKDDQDIVETFKSPKATLNLNKNHRVRLFYDFIEPILNTIEDTIYLAGNQWNDTIHIQNVGNGILKWGATTKYDWIGFETENYGEGDADLPLVFTPNYSEETRTGFVLVINADKIIPFDTVWIVQESYGDNVAIQLGQGWSGLSSYIQPSDPDIDRVFEDIEGDIEIVQNLDGVYWPGQNVNTLVNWDMTSGYAIKTNNSTYLSIYGNRNYGKTVNLTSGWNIIPVLSSCEVPVYEIFGSVAWNMKIAKEVAGTKIFWPQYGINTIGSLQPGNAYYLLLQFNGSITFTDCEELKSVSVAKSSKPEPIEPWGVVANSNNTHIIAIPGELINSSGLKQDDILGVFSPDGSFVGYAIIQANTNNHLVVFGKDFTLKSSTGIDEGSFMECKVYRPETDESFIAEVEYLETMPQQGIFTTNGVSAFKSLKLIEEAESNIRVFPNPASGTLNIDCGSFENTYLNVYDMFGKVVLSLNLPSGNFTLETGNELKAGIYNFEFSNELVNVVKRVVIK